MPGVAIWLISARRNDRTPVRPDHIPSLSIVLRQNNLTRLQGGAAMSFAEETRRSGAGRSRAR